MFFFSFDSRGNKGASVIQSRNALPPDPLPANGEGANATDFGE